MRVLEFLQEWLPLLVVVNIVASALIVLAFRRSARAGEAKWDGIERRVGTLEKTSKLLPTREDLHLLRIEMIDTRGELKTMKAEVEADRRQFSAEVRSGQASFDIQLGEARRLVERTEKTLNMVLEHLLDREK